MFDIKTIQNRDEIENKFNIIIEAIKMNDVDKIRKFITSYIDVCENDEFDYKPIETAIAYNSIEVLKILLRYNTNFNSYDSNGSSLMSLAIYYDKLEIVELLIELGVDINIGFRENYYVNGIEYFDGSSSIELAIDDRNYIIASFLLKNGVKTNLKTDDEIKVFIALIDSEIELVKKYINEGVNVNVQDDSGFTPLTHAVIFIEDIPFIEWLINNSAFFDIKDNDDQSLLSFIIDSLNVQEIEEADKFYYNKVLQIFIENGADFQMLQGSNVHPCEFLSVLDLSDPMKLTLINKISKNDYEKSIMINSALINAMNDYDIKSFEYFIKQHENIDFQDENGDTLLMKAIEEENAPFIKKILDNNPNLSIKNNKGETTIDVVERIDTKMSIYTNSIMSLFESHECYINYLKENKLQFFINLQLIIKFLFTNFFSQINIALIILFIIFFVISRDFFRELLSIISFFWLWSLGLTIVHWKRDFYFYKKRKGIKYRRLDGR